MLATMEYTYQMREGQHSMFGCYHSGDATMSRMSSENEAVLN